MKKIIKLIKINNLIINLLIITLLIKIKTITYKEDDNNEVIKYNIDDNDYLTLLIKIKTITIKMMIIMKLLNIRLVMMIILSNYDNDDAVN